jgi:hypothetical protein
MISAVIAVSCWGVCVGSLVWQFVRAPELGDEIEGRAEPCEVSPAAYTGRPECPPRSGRSGVAVRSPARKTSRSAGPSAAPRSGVASGGQ